MLALVVSLGIAVTGGCGGSGQGACVSRDRIRENLEPGPLVIAVTAIFQTKEGVTIPIVRFQNKTEKAIHSWQACYVFYDALGKVMYFRTDGQTRVEISKGEGPESSFVCYQGSASIDPNEIYSTRLKTFPAYWRAKTFQACVFAVHFEDGSVWQR